MYLKLRDHLHIFERLLKRLDHLEKLVEGCFFAQDVLVTNVFQHLDAASKPSALGLFLLVVFDPPINVVDILVELSNLPC